MLETQSKFQPMKRNCCVNDVISKSSLDKTSSCQVNSDGMSHFKIILFSVYIQLKSVHLSWGHTGMILYEHYVAHIIGAEM